MTSIATRINASGLWASYGDASELLGYGPRGWRTCAEKNWENNVRLARKDGTTDHHEDPSKGEEWLGEHPEIVLIDAIFGYHVSSGASHHAGGVMPKEWRLLPQDLRALAGLSPSNVHLRMKIEKQGSLLEEWLEAAPLDAPYRNHVEDMLAQNKDLLRFLKSNKEN